MRVYIHSLQRPLIQQANHSNPPPPSAVAVGQAMVVGPSLSLRLQLSISLAGALTFLTLGAASFKGAALAAAVFGCAGSVCGSWVRAFRMQQQAARRLQGSPLVDGSTDARPTTN